MVSDTDYMTLAGFLWGFRFWGGRWYLGMRMYFDFPFPTIRLVAFERARWRVEHGRPAR